MIKFKSLNQSSKFIEILKKKRLTTRFFTIYFNKNSKKKVNVNKYLNISFVMKKNIGNAVKRNKIKRKLKSAVQKALEEKQLIDLDYTYIIFGKNNVYSEKFAHVFDEVNVICYFRDQFDVAVSLYSTALKVNSSADVHSFVDQAKPENYYYDYLTIADNWTGVFGHHNCIFKIYDRQCFIDKDIRKDFIHPIKSDIDFEKLNM